MSVAQFILTTTAAIGSANAASSQLTQVMSIATGYNETQLHSNVTAFDVCMYLFTGYQFNQLSFDKNITTEAYDDHDQGVAKILTRYVNGKYDDTTEALDTYGDPPRISNFNASGCAGVTDDDVIDLYFLSTAGSTYDDQSFGPGQV